MGLFRIAMVLSVGFLMITQTIESGRAADLLLPNKEQAQIFAISDAELLDRYGKANQTCLGSNQRIETFLACAERDIIAATLTHRGYYRGSECNDESKAGWVQPAPSFPVTE